MPGASLKSMAERLRPRTVLLAVLAALVVIAAAGVTHRVVRLRRAIGAVATDVRRVPVGSLLASDASDDMPALPHLRALRRDLAALEDECAALRRLAAPWAPSIARADWLPVLPDAATVLIGGLDAAERLARSAWWIALALESDVELDGAVNTASGVPITLEADPRRTLGEALERQRPALLAARADLAGAGAALGRLPLVPARWAALGRSAPRAVDALLVGGRIVSAQEPRNYLLLVQNDDERRATGGFISSVALLRWEDGRLAGVEYHNSKDIEAYRAAHPAPPEALGRIMGASILLLRDANWSPDFPTSAEVIASLYELDMETPVHGVIAVDPTLGALLLEALGPLEMPDYGVRITADNLRDVVVQFWEEPLAAAALGTPGQGADWLAHRKDVGGALLDAGLQRVRHLDAADLLPLAASLDGAIRGRHLLAWSVTDPALQADLDRAGVTGRLLSAPGDYLQVVDSNVGWNKADRNVARQVHYRVAPEGDALVAEATLTYRNDAVPVEGACDHRSYYGDSYENLANRCYWNYLRIYVPGGSRLVGATGLESVDESGELGRRVYGGLLVVPPGEERAVTFRYVLPDALREAALRGAYALLLQQQAGDVGSRVSVECAGARTVRAEDATGVGPRARTALAPLVWDRDWTVRAGW